MQIKPDLTGQVPVSVGHMIDKCLGEDLSQRMDMTEIVKKFRNHASSKKGIVEIIMEGLETHNEKLEEMVDQRLQELQQVRPQKRITYS